jgi:hypothetical protein
MKLIIHFILSFYQMFGHQARLYCDQQSGIKLHKNLCLLRPSDFDSMYCSELFGHSEHSTQPGTTEQHGRTVSDTNWFKCNGWNHRILPLLYSCSVFIPDTNSLKIYRFKLQMNSNGQLIRFIVSNTWTATGLSQLRMKHTDKTEMIKVAHDIICQESVLICCRHCH